MSGLFLSPTEGGERGERFSVTAFPIKSTLALRRPPRRQNLLRQMADQTEEEREREREGRGREGGGKKFAIMDGKKKLRAKGPGRAPNEYE